MSRRSWLAAVLALVAALPTFAPGVTGQETARPGAEWRDLAVLTLRPDDVEQTGFVHVGAFVDLLEDEAANVAAYRGVSVEEVAGRLRDAGWRRRYAATIGLPAGNGSSRMVQVVRSYVAEYDDAEGAAAGFAYVEDETGVETAEDVAGGREFGDDSEVTRERGTSNVDGRAFRLLDLTFRVGNLVAGVTVIDYPSRDFDDPDLAMVEALAEVLEERVATATAQGTTLGGAVLRLGGTEHEVITYDDAYYRLAGRDIPLADESEEAAAARVASYRDAVDVYQLWQGIDADSDTGVLFGATLLRFPDEDAAAIWVRDLADILGDNPYYGDLESVPGGGDPGEGWVALSYLPSGVGSARAVLVAAPVGADVVRVQLVPSSRTAAISLDAVTELASDQVACLEDGGCADVTPPVATPTPHG